MFEKSTGKRRITVIILAVLMVFLPFISYAQNIDIYNNTNGLITSNINDACQTTDGYIWLAQYEGLTRYNGEKFQTFNHVDVDGKDTSLEQLTQVENDSKNRLYIGTKKEGVILYEKGVYHRLTKKNGLNVNDISVHNNVVYVATTDGAYIYKNGKISWIKDTEGKAILSVSASGSSVYYATEDGRVFSYNGSSHLFYSKEVIKTVRVFSHNVYMGSMYGNLIRIRDGRTKNYKVADNSPINAIAMHDNNIYLGTDSGTFIVENGNVKIMDDQNSDATVNAIFFDYESGMWIASINGLVNLHFLPIENLFDTYKLEEKNVNACYYYNNLLYVGTDSGLTVIDEKHGKIIKNVLTERLDGIRIRDFAVYKGKLYVATYSSEELEVVIFDGSSIQYLKADEMLGNVRNPKALFDQSQIRCLTVHKDMLLIGTNYGLTIVRNGKCKTVQVNPRPLSITAYDDKIYVCTDGDGIHTFDYNLKELDVVKKTKGDTVLKCIRYGDGLLYCAGTNLFRMENDKTTQLQFENIGSIVDLKEMKDNLLVYSNSGVFFLDKKALEKNKIVVEKKYNSSNGMRGGVTANGRSFYKKSTDTFYFNCQNGVYKYENSAPFNQSDSIKIAVDGLTVDGQEMPVDDSITLDKNTNRLVVDLAALTFIDRENISVYYQLSGVDKEVCKNNYDNKQTLEYTNLRGGNYTLNIYCVNASGLKSNKISLSIKKELKWYEKTISQIIMVIIAVLALLFGVRIHTRRKMAKLNEQSEWRKHVAIDSLEAIANTIDAKDDYTKGHSMRVARLAVCVGEKMKMTETQLENLYYIGLMHDVGKVGIPDNILTKPGKLSKEEFEVMKTHPDIGQSILKDIKSIPNLEDGVIYHHERYDGTGYPNGLKGEEIPLVGRVICCCDCYDAMATKRCYKESIKDDEIIREFERCRGTQFDPKIVDIVLMCIRSGEFHRIIEETLEENVNK